MNTSTSELLRVDELTKHFPVRRGVWQSVTGSVRAVDGVSFHVSHGETLGLVGESGCGKTTVARTIVRLTKPSSGRVLFQGIDVQQLSAWELRKIRPKMQMIFQDPYSSLDPRMTVGASIAEPLVEHHSANRRERTDLVRRLMELVGVDRNLMHRYPHEFSGGQRQRIGIARALALEPDLIVCDEPLSALDVSIQGQIVNLLKDVQTKVGVAYLFISHDLGMVRHLCDRVAVMYLGKIVESGYVEEVFQRPRHPYTQALLSAADASRGTVLSGEIPSATDPPPGCSFHTRCPLAERRCREDPPPSLEEVGESHEASCHLV
jgi:oligopeptide/dipeptide ABC transporter ATP-binding protein